MRDFVPSPRERHLSPWHWNVKPHSSTHQRNQVKLFYHFWILFIYFFLVEQYVHILSIGTCLHEFFLIILVCLICMHWMFIYKGLSKDFKPYSERRATAEHFLFLWQLSTTSINYSVGWDCKIHRLHLCSVLAKILNNLMVRFLWCLSFRECRVLLHCHCSQVHSGSE